MIDRSLNYGRHIIADFAAKIGHYETVLDIGAGKGDDLAIYKSKCGDARLLALEGFEPNVAKLASRGIEVFLHDLERKSNSRARQGDILDISRDSSYAKNRRAFRASGSEFSQPSQQSLAATRQTAYVYTKSLRAR